MREDLNKEPQADAGAWGAARRAAAAQSTQQWGAHGRCQHDQALCCTRPPPTGAFATVCTHVHQEPLHYAADFKKADAVGLLLTAAPQAAMTADGSGDLPLHPHPTPTQPTLLRLHLRV